MIPSLFVDMQGFIYNVADGVAQGFGWEGIVEIDPMNSDLVVHKDSQSLGQLNDATIMVDMVHSNGQNNTDIANFMALKGWYRKHSLRALPIVFEIYLGCLI